MLGIVTRETDLSILISEEINSTPAAIVFESVWGPVYKLYDIKNEADLVSTFGKPGSFQINYQTCINYVKYSTNVKACRVSNGHNARSIKNQRGRGWLWNSGSMILWNSGQKYVELAEPSRDWLWDSGNMILWNSGKNM